jgi:sugar transport system permease protein
MSSTDTVDPPVARPSRRLLDRGRRPLTGQRLNELGLVAAIVVLCVILASTADGFSTKSNMLGILRDAATVGIAAFGVTLVIIAAEIDISIGPAVAFSSVILAKACTSWGLPVSIAVLLTLALGVLWGAAAGSLRAFFGVPSFIATLGLWSALRGLGQYMTHALPVGLPVNGFFDRLAGTVLGIPTPAVFMLVLFAVFTWIAHRTVYGRSVFAVGGNANAARLAGINLRRVRIALFATTGFLSALTGILLAARLGSGNGGSASGLEFDVIAAVVIGGTALSGGRGSMLGTLLGVLFITLIGNGLVLLGVDPFMQNVVRGVIIVSAVLVNIVISKRDPARSD